MKNFGMRIHMRNKVISCLMTICLIMPLLPVYNVSFAEDSDVIQGNPVTITDSVTGCTYNYVNFNGLELVHPYMGHEAWTLDGKSFLCGVNNKVANPDSTDENDKYHGKLYLYNTETSEFTKIADKAAIGDSVTGVIGSDNCVYYSTGTAVNKYDIATKKTTVIIPGSYGFYPSALTVSNDCNYIAFSSNNYNNNLWYDDTKETAIFRYNIAEDKIEHYNYGFDYSNQLNHHQMNPTDPDIVFFAHDGVIAIANGEIEGYDNLYDREWTVNFETGEIKNVFKQGKTTGTDKNGNEEEVCVVFTTHESWSSSGKYLYLNCYSNSDTNGKGKCIIRCYPDGSHREYLRGADTGTRSADHAMATSDDKFTIVDSGCYVYLLNNETYQQTEIAYCAGRLDENGDARPHPYHPHPNVARNNYKALWGMSIKPHTENEVVGVAWYDFTELAEANSADGGRYAVNNTIDRVSYEGLDCESSEKNYANKDCYYAATDKYLYFDINENVVDGTNESVTLSFDYYDNSTNDLVLTYTAGARSEAEDPYGNDLAASENASITIPRTATNTWKTYTTTIESGNFENINPYRTDFKVGGGDVYLANVEVSNIADGYAGGDGTKENPYQISNAAELRYFSNQVRETSDRTAVDSNLSYAATKVSDSSAATYTPERYHVFTGRYFKLTADIDLCNEPFTPIGNLIYNFNGHFDGNGHVISNVNIDGTTPQAFERYAFFGATGANVEITNLGIENVTCKFKTADSKYSATINGDDYTYNDRTIGSAGFVSSYAGGTFTNCYLKNVEVRDMAPRMASGGTGGFFGLGYGTVKATEENGYNAMTVTNCYINGATLRSHSSASYGFIAYDVKPGTTSQFDDNDVYHITKTLNNCYTANISRGYYDNNSLYDSNGKYDGLMYPFTGTGFKTTYINCYTTSKGEETVKNGDIYITSEASDRALAPTDIETLNAGLVDNANYYADVKSVNDGYPIFTDMSDPVIWDGTTDKKPAGTGDEDDPYLISTKEELVWFKNSVNTISDEGKENGYTSEADAYVKLIADIDLEGIDWEPIGNTQVEFIGTFDGNGHVISNFKIKSKETNNEQAYKTADATTKTSYCTDKIYQYNGFFGRTGNGSVVKNLGIEDAEIKFYNHDYYYQFATDELGVITETGKTAIRALYNGGMVGFAGGEFINCYVKNSEVKNMKRDMNDHGIGGFVGSAGDSSSFVGCYVKGVELCASYPSYIGGFAAKANNNTIFEDCYVADVVEESTLATNGNPESSSYKDSTIYGFAYIKDGTENDTTCFSTLSDHDGRADHTPTEEDPIDTATGEYIADASVGTVSTSTDEVTQEEIVTAVATYENLAPDNSQATEGIDGDVNEGYPICLWQMSSKAMQKYDADNCVIPDTITADLPLTIGKFGSSVTWTADPSIIDENGSVTFYQDPKTVLLSATTADGYTTKSTTVTVVGKVPFESYSFNVTKDGVDASDFVSGGTINKVSFYKNRTAENCYMYTVLYDKTDGNRMIGCSIDFIDDNALSAKATHTINLTTQITLPNDDDTSKYVLKLIFVTDETKFKPICDNFEYYKSE